MSFLSICSLLAPAGGRRWGGSLLGLGLLAGCHYHPAYPEVHEHQVFFSDFENLMGWYKDAPAFVTTERVHSGRYAAKVDAAHPYSFAYHLKLKEHFTTRPRRLHLSAWVWLDNSHEDAQLVFAINSPGGPPGQPKLYKPLYLSDNWPYRRWTHVGRDIDLPADLSSEAELVVYLWAGSAGHPVYSDDWELTELH